MDSKLNATLKQQLTEQLKELVICISHSWGGLEQVAASDALERARMGIDTRVLCLEGTPIYDQLQRLGEVELVPLDFRPRDHFDLKMRKIFRRAIDEGVNLVHTHQTSLLGSICPWLWRESKVSIFASRHIMSDHDKRDFYHRAIYSRLDGLIVMSKTLRQNVIATHPIRRSRVKVVNLGLDFDAFDPQTIDPTEQRAVWGAEPDTLVIGLVGRIDPAKGQDTFIKAAAGLLRSLSERHVDRKIKFVMVGEETLGSTSNYLSELKALVAQFRIEDSVVFAGYQQNIPEVMRAIDILVMPSRQEAFGLVAIEAMAMESPIVISRGGSADEIVGDEKYGLLVRPEDAFDLQRKLWNLIEEPEVARKMGQAARKHVRKNYDRKIRLEKTLEIYHRALVKRRILV